MKRLIKWGATIVGALALSLVLVKTTAAQEAVTVEQLEEALRGINTVWLLICAFLVFFMQAGFALVEAGSTRSKNVVNILMKNLMDFCFATVAFWAVGYGLMFGTGTEFIGLSHFFLTGAEESFVTGIPTLAFWLFQLVFAGTAATIVSGAMAERTKFKAYIVYSVFITLIIYPIFGKWTWGGGWLADLGFIDFAGSTIVHSVGGWAALVGAWLLGPRIGRFSKEGKPNTISGHSLPLVTLGGFILWIGWFGFNPGSQVLAHGSNADAISLIAANTNIAAAAGALTALVLTWMMNGKPDLSFAINGVLGGLVAITAPCAFVTPLASIIIGAVGGAVVVYGTLWLEKSKIDDPVGAVPVHLMSGIWGTLAVGLFHTTNGLFYSGSTAQLVAQLIGIAACGVWVGGTSFLLFSGIKATVGLRVSAEEEERGLDFDEHGQVGYPDINALPQPVPATAPVTSGVSRSPAK